MKLFMKLAGALIVLDALALLAQSELPDGKGKDVVLRVCAAECHGVEPIAAERRSKQGWSNIVDAMISRGAKATDEEIDAIIDYLAAHFGRQSPKAAASEIRGK